MRNDIWLIVFGCICRYNVVEFRPIEGSRNSYIRVRLDCEGCMYELVGRLSPRAFDVSAMRIAGRNVKESLSLIPFETFGEAYAYQTLGNTGIPRRVFRDVKEMKSQVRHRGVEISDKERKNIGRRRRNTRMPPPIINHVVPWILWPSESTKTYIMQSAYGYFKIGKTKDLHSREATLKCSDPSIHLIAACPDDIEGPLHQRYSAHQYKGEWYSFTEEELDELIREYGFVRI